MASKGFLMTAVLGLRDTMSHGLEAAIKRWGDFRAAVKATEFHDMNRQLKLARKSLKNFEKETKGVAEAIGYPFTAVAGAVGFSVKSAVTGFAQIGDGYDKMSARTGVSAEKLQEWTFAATHAGASQEILEDSLKDLSKNLAETAAGGTGPASQLFEALGISAKDAAGKLRPVEEVFVEVADAIQRNEDPALRAKMAMTLMGESGRKLVPMLSDGAKGLDDAAARARKFGLVLSNDAVKAAADMTDHLDDMRACIGAVGNMIGARLAPIIIRVADRFRDLAVTNREVFGEKFEKVARSFVATFEKIDFDRLASGILTIADYALRAFSAIGGFNTVLYGAGVLMAGKSVMAAVSLGSSLFSVVKSFGAAITAVKAFATVANLSLGPIGLALGAISLAAGVVIANWDEICAGWDRLTNSVRSAVDSAGESWAEFKESVVTGFRNGWETAKSFVTRIKDSLIGFGKVFADSFSRMPEAFTEAASSLFDRVKQSLKSIGEFVRGFFASLDFSSLIPDWALKMFSGGSTEKAQSKSETHKEESAPLKRTRFIEERQTEVLPAAFAPESRTRMSGEMLVRVAASPGTTAQLAGMSADGMKLVGNVGYSDRLAEDY